MDLHLPLMADINLHLGVAEEALAESPPAYVAARSQLEKAQQSLAELRSIYPELSDARQQGLIAAMAKPLAQRARAIERALPRPTALSDGEAVIDPEQEQEPS